jgi:hypothetical protein
VKWGDAKTYAWLHSVSGSQYQNQLLYWLQAENPALHALVLKELGRGDRKERATPAPQIGQAHENG